MDAETLPRIPSPLTLYLLGSYTSKIVCPNEAQVSHFLSPLEGVPCVVSYWLHLIPFSFTNLTAAAAEA